MSVSWERLMRIEPIPFDSELVALCEEAIRETCGAVHRCRRVLFTMPPRWRARASPP